MNPKGPHSESTEPRTRTSLSAEKEDKTQHREGKPPREGLADPQSPHLEATELRMWTSSPIENEEPSYKHPVSMVRIAYIDIHIPLFPSRITLGNSCSAYSHLFQACVQGHHYHRHCSSDKACADNTTFASHMSHVTHVLLMPDLLLGSHKGSSMHAPEHPHQCKQYISLQSQTMREMLRSVGRSADRQGFLYRGQDVVKSISDL